MLGRVWSNQSLLPKFTSIIRCMTSTEVSTALRPFYFSVHPDLFGQYPIQRQTNENSLKQLSAFLEMVQSQKYPKPCYLQFYIREKEDKENLILIKLLLQEKNIRDLVLNILKTFHLPTDFVDKIPKIEPKQDPYSYNLRKSSYEGNIDFTNIRDDDPIFGPLFMRRKINKARESQTLKTWIEESHEKALEFSHQYRPIRDKVSQLQKELTQQWGILEIRWECGWNESHFKACLQGLKCIAEQYPDVMYILRGRILVFAPFTGVSLDGHVMLNTGEVRHNWLDLIKNIRKYEAALTRIPAFEKSVSQVLRNIKVERRKFMPKIIANEYELNLQQLTTSLMDYRGRQDFPKSWPASLSDYHLVVETGAGPLMVSPTGQFIVPCSCPGILLVKFITDNFKEALARSETYKNDKYIERALKKQCVDALQLIVLRKDDCVSPELMIQCCKHLLEHKNDLIYLRGLHLNITTYYSVLSDGVVCIPWNWIL